MIRLAILLVALTGTALAQTPPAPPPAAQAEQTPPKPRPALKLNLDEIDPPRPRITFDPKDGKDPVKTLPGLGDAPASSSSWEKPSSTVYPPDTNPGMR